MEIVLLDGKNSFSMNNKIVATIGEFDGIHIAHQELFKKTIEISKDKKYLSAVITFDPHPDVYLKKDESVILSNSEKLSIIESYGFDYLFIIKFNNQIVTMSHPDFIENYLTKINIAHLVIGFDFKYGYKGLGNKDTISSDSNNQITVTTVPELKVGNHKIGSSYIKKLLNDGAIEEANLLLGRKYKLTGHVIHGNNIGEKIKVPTANLKLDFSSTNLKQGVYVGICKVLGKKYYSICNIGHNPSFNYRDFLSYEIHIIDENFASSIYDEYIELELVKYLREEKTFKNIEDFKIQIECDKKEAFEILNNAL